MSEIGSNPERKSNSFLKKIGAVAVLGAVGIKFEKEPQPTNLENRPPEPQVTLPSSAPKENPTK